MKVPRRLKLGIGLLLLCGLGFSFWWLHVRPKRALAEYKRSLAASGERLTLTELIPPPLAEGENSARLLLKAHSLMMQSTLLLTNAPPASLMVTNGRAMVGWRDAAQLVSSTPVTTNSWAEAEQAVADMADALALLRQIPEHPAFDFDLQYQQGFKLLLPHLAPTKSAAQQLSAVVVTELHQGDTAHAVQDARALLALSQGMGREPFVISQLVRIAIAGISANASWELLQSDAVTDEQLAGLQRDWLAQDFAAGMTRALEMERAMGDQLAASMRTSSAEFRTIVSGPPGAGGGTAGSTGSGNWLDQSGEWTRNAWFATKFKTKETMWRASWSYADEMKKLQADAVMLASARSAISNGAYGPALRLQASQLEAFGIPARSDNKFDEPANQDFHNLLSSSFLPLGSSLKRLMVIEIHRQLVVAAIALKRYRLRHGDYPAELTALTPEFLSAGPRDPVDGQSLRYRRVDATSFLLYSIGEDEKDDGGNPLPPPGNPTESFSRQHGRDLVWPQPASAAEVAAYFEKVYGEIREKNEGFERLNSRMSPDARQAYEARYGKFPGSSPTATNSPGTNTLR